MILTRFGSTVFIRASAIVAVLIGLLYMPSVFFLPITGLGPELAGGQRIAELWAMYAVYGGIGLFLGSFLLNVARTVGSKRILLAVALISIFLLIAAQLPPLFWWMLVGGAVFSWSSMVGLFLHLFLLILSLWGAIVIIHAIESLKGLD